MRRYLVLAVLGITLIAPSLASAQILSFGRGSRGGSNYYDGNSYGYPSYGWGGYGGYGGYYRPYYYGSNSAYPSWGSGYTGWGDRYYGDRYYPDTYYYSTPSYGYSSPSYRYGSPSYSQPMYDQNYSGTYQAGYNTSMGNLGNRVRLQVIVPDPNAELLIQGERMNTMGPTRTFISPDLQPGQSYSYTLTMRRGGGGEERRTVDVQPGSTYTIDFSRPSNERMDMDRSNERLPAPRSDYNAPSSNQPRSDTPKRD
jgi:uncharacterized protein (TIGR03000 family)